MVRPWWTIRRAVAKELEAMADAVVEYKSIAQLGETALETDHFPLSPREGEYANIMVSRYREVESILLDLPT